MSVKIKETITKVTVDSTHMRLVQLTNDVYKMKTNIKHYEWEESNRHRAIERFIKDTQYLLGSTVKRNTK